MDTYEPATPQKSDPDSDDVPNISYRAALESMKTYVPLVFRIPMSIHRKVSN